VKNTNSPARPALPAGVTTSAQTPGPIERVYVSTYKGDLRLTRICVASIRRWHPDVPISLIRDYGQGDFNTREIEDRWDVDLLPTGRRTFGWGFAKLEPLFLPAGGRFLVLDSDTVFTGPVLDDLRRVPAQFVVDDETQPPDEVKRLYFDVGALRRIDPDFRFGGRTFNSGQWVGTPGVVRRDDFSAVVEWAATPRLRHPEYFMPGDQGVLNYVLEKLAGDGRLTLERRPLMLWAPRDLAGVDLPRLAAGGEPPRVIHWAGVKSRRLGGMPRADILRYFERYYYSRVSFGGVRRPLRAAASAAGHAGHRLTGLARRCRQRLPRRR